MLLTLLTATALTFAVSPTFWTQASIAEARERGYAVDTEVRNDIIALIGVGVGPVVVGCVPTEVPRGSEVAGNGPPWTMACETSTPRERRRMSWMPSMPGLRA